MKVTFPHMGNIYLAAKAVFDTLGVEYIIPELNNRKALDIGVKYSPEEICLPFKIMIGNYIESIERGADTVIIVGSCGPCRFGEYGELQMNLIKRLGYDVDFVMLDAPKDIGIKEFLDRISKITCSSKKSKLEKMMAIKNGLTVINLCDSIDDKAHQLAGYEVNRGECKRLLKEYKDKASQSDGVEELINILKEYKKKLMNIKIDKNKQPVKVGIIGEIYTVIEPFSNLYIEDRLMEFGVSTKRCLTPSWWVKDMLMKSFKLNSLDIRRASLKYLPYYIGGHARECIGETVLGQRSGLDGAIQLFPMGCMPEIVSKAILPTISKDKDFPILTLVIDEMTGEAGYITRIEAFLDMLERRKKENVLYGS